MTNWAGRERQALVDALREVGPDAPTLCEGWTTTDLARHILRRERFGLIPRNLSFEQLLAAIARGPAIWSPFRAFDNVANLLEMFVHCEDVRRAQMDWQPRELPEELQSAMWRRLSQGARILWRRCPVGVNLVSPRGTVATRSAGQTATAVGQVGELVLLTFGRNAVHVMWEGDESVVDIARGSNRNI